jgi:lipopolysaccharide transport system permease protein
MTQIEVRSDTGNRSQPVSPPDAAHDGRLLETVIEPERGWTTLGLGELWTYRDLVFHLTLRNIKVRYKQTLLGVLWAVLQPVLMMAVFIALSMNQILPGGSGRVPYPVFVLAGLLPWLFFQTAVAGAANSVVNSEGLITKVYFPRLAIPIAAVAAALVDLAVSFVVLLAVMAWYGIGWTAGLLAVPVAVILLTLAATGIGTLLGAVTVSYRDVRHAIGFVLQVWMFATPTIYIDVHAPRTEAARVAAAGSGGETAATPASSAKYQKTGWLSRLNPMTAPIDFFRAAVLGQPIPWRSLGEAAVVHVVLFLAGILYFRRVEDSFADVI